MVDKKLVLVVEDEKALQEAIKLILEKEGVDTLVASSGEEALEILKKTKPNLVWLDILLPGVNGLEVLRNIRETETLKNLPVVIVSVSGGEEKIKMAFNFKVVDYLIKSEYTINELVKKIKQILNDIN